MCEQSGFVCIKSRARSEGRFRSSWGSTRSASIGENHGICFIIEEDRRVQEAAESEVKALQEAGEIIGDDEKGKLINAERIVEMVKEMSETDLGDVHGINRDFIDEHVSRKWTFDRLARAAKESGESTTWGRFEHLWNTRLIHLLKWHLGIPIDSDEATLRKTLKERGIGSDEEPLAKAKEKARVTLKKLWEDDTNWQVGIVKREVNTYANT